MKTVFAVALAVIALAGCTDTDHANPTGQPTEIVPTFDAAQDWQGDNSPILDWSQAQRDAFTAQYADATAAALADAGLPPTPPDDPTAVDTLQRALAVGPAVPRPAREITLLDTTQARTDTNLSAADEAAALDAAWTTCLKLQAGQTYEDLVFLASATYDASPRTSTDTAQLAAVLYAPIICYENANRALDAIAGIDGPEILD